MKPDPWDRPAPHVALREFLTRNAEAIKRYRGRGRVAELADAAEAITTRLEQHFTLPAFIRHMDVWYMGYCDAEGAYEALARELRIIEGGSKGGQRRAENDSDDTKLLRQKWEAARKSCTFDAEADRAVTETSSFEHLNEEQIKWRRRRAEKHGRWLRPTKK